MRHLAVFLFFFCVCSSAAPDLMDQRRTVQNKVFDKSTPDIVLKAFRISLSKEGHIIRTFEPKKGLLVVSLRKGKKEGTWNEWTRFLTDDKTAKLEVSVAAKPRGSNSVETRISMQRITRDSLGRLRGTEVYDETLYQSLYGMVNTLLGNDDDPVEEVVE